MNTEISNTISNDILNLFFMGWTNSGNNASLCEECFFNIVDGIDMLVYKLDVPRNQLTENDIFRVSKTNGLVLECKNITGTTDKQFKIGFVKNSNYSVCLIDTNEYIDFLAQKRRDKNAKFQMQNHWGIGFEKNHKNHKKSG